MLHTDYRVTAPVPINKLELLNEYFASDAKPSESFCHPIECDPKENPYNVQYVRSGAVPSGEDPKSYDLGKVNLATQGIPAASTNLGELWVTYEVELRKPQITVGGVGSTQFRGSGTHSTTALLGATITTKVNDLDISVSSSGLVYTFPRGSFGWYTIIHRVSGGAVAYVHNATTYTNCTNINVKASGVAAGVTNPFYAADVGTGTGVMQHYIYIPDPSVIAVITMAMTTVNNCTASDCTITRLSPTFGAAIA